MWYSTFYNGTGVEGQLLYDVSYVKDKEYDLTYEEDEVLDIKYIEDELIDVEPIELNEE